MWNFNNMQQPQGEQMPQLPQGIRPMTPAQDPRQWAGPQGGQQPPPMGGPAGGTMPSYGGPQGPTGQPSVPNPYSRNPAWEEENRRMMQPPPMGGPAGGIMSPYGGPGTQAQPMRSPLQQPPRLAGYNPQGAAGGAAKRMGGQTKGAMSTMGPNRAQQRQQMRGMY